jgi:hypothetical protein
MELNEYLRTSEAVLQFARQYLGKRGWFASLDGVPRNNDGEVPWITYPAFQQLKRIVKPELRVFEYGCGASSLWWGRHVREVVSVDHNAAWANMTIGARLESLTVVVREMDAPVEASRSRILEPFFASEPYLPLSNSVQHNIDHGLLCRQFASYALELTRYPVGHFDIVVVDGMARVLTAWLAARYVNPQGLIVFDNAERWQYNSAYQALRDQGFYRIDYYGPGPVNRQEWCTSIFTKTLQPFSASIDSPKMADNDLGW